MLGEVIHGYRVDRALSVDKGGMGDVFFATHVESGADAVVKVLKPEMSARRDIVTRFFNEARAAASIHHPGIVQIHNVGYHNERAYLLMERLRGDDLENRLRAGPVPLDRAIVFMRQAAGAIAAAHDRGIVHRDLKPANLFVVPDPDVVGGERVRVLDFGIAKLSLDTGGNKTQGIFGTPAYMSPEQCASSGDVDPRSDLYALGCIFYELVTGRPPFGHGGIELVAAHLRDTPAPPRTVASWVPPAVDQIIMHLLAKHPDQRPPSCAALISALDHIHATLPPAVPHGPVSAAMSAPMMSAAGASVPSMVPSYPPNAPTAPTAPRNRNLLWIGLALAAAAAMIVAAVIVTGDSSSKAPAVAAGPAAADAAVTTPPPADAAVAETPPPPPPPPSGDPKAQASELNETGKVAMFDSRYDDAITAFTRAAALDPSPLIFFNLGVAHYQAGHCGEARIALQAALADDAADAKLREKTKKLLKSVGDCAPKPVASNEPKPKPKPTPPDPKPVPNPRPTPPDPNPVPNPDPNPNPHPDNAVGRTRRAVDLNNEGRTAYKVGMYAKSAKLFREAIALDAQPSYYFNLGGALVSLRNCDEAKAIFDRIINGKADQSMKEKAAAMKARCP